MKKTFILVVGLLILSLFSGCFKSFESRRNYAIELTQSSFGASKKELFQYLYKQNLSVLNTVRDETLKGPKAASVVLVNGKGNYSLIVFWVEKCPTVDGVEIRLDYQEPPVTVLQPKYYSDINQSSSGQTILFGFEYVWGKESSFCKKLEQNTSEKKIEARLVHAKEPVTDWFSVKFCKDGKLN
jgi:hypothetical protein